MKSSTVIKVLAAIALVFGALTLVSGGRALFGDAAARAAVGNVVGFVLWFNFLAGFAYLAAAIGLWLGRRWAVALAALLAIATALVAAGFGMHVLNGGAYEMRTVGALALRFGFWAVVSLVAWRGLRMTR
ncbi:MAG: hypothetical protein KBF63_00960 [Rhodoferax sp.]|jgi:hypothetical protein|nr:hypothetical protein [Rhodoferax sp.]MBP9927814.1 hypothetical protein [Rhodoferax sp.]HQZ04620.1 hypothetical protein [Burkholderiaceae bacterium]